VAADNNLVMTGGSNDLADMIASTKRGLLLTTLWLQFRDGSTRPRLLLTGADPRTACISLKTARVTAAVNNFRFNESPLGPVATGHRGPVSARTNPAAGMGGLGDQERLSRRCGSRDFHMSSVSQAQ